ncbi:MAG: stage III sporulation protein AE [Oscillospiraceae bacterium]|nr:stage III sporulation protein AE [Oscillospiraceae bacterium]
MKQWLTACLFVAALLFLCGQALAAQLPPELERLAPEAAALADGGEGLLPGVRRLWREGWEQAGEYLLAGVRSTAAIMAGVVLLGVAESAAPAGKDTLGQYVSITGALWITAVSAGNLNALIGLGQQTIVDLSQLSKALLPVLAAAEAASGGVTAASARQVAAVFFSDILLTAIERVLLPAVYLYIGTAAAGAVLEGELMERVGSLLKKLIGWALGGLLTLFTAFLTISGAVAGTADAQAVKVAKAAVSAAVPVVGGILSEAAESMLAGAGLLRGLLGAFGALAVLSFCLVPFLRLGGQYLLYQCASLAAAAAGPKKLTGLLTALGDAFGLVLAMTAASALLLLISLVSSLTAVVP